MPLATREKNNIRRSAQCHATSHDGHPARGLPSVVVPVGAWPVVRGKLLRSFNITAPYATLPQSLRLVGQALRFAARPTGSHKGRLCLAPRPTARAAALPLHFNCALVRARAARKGGGTIPAHPGPSAALGLQRFALTLPCSQPSHPSPCRAHLAFAHARSLRRRTACRAKPLLHPQGAPQSMQVCLQKRKSSPTHVAWVAAKEGRWPFVYLPINCTACAGVTMRMPLYSPPRPCKCLSPETMRSARAATAAAMT